MRSLITIFTCAAVAAALAAAAMPAVGAGTAPDLIGGGPWFNTNGRPVTLRDLRGKVVGVEMWTAGCDNCLNVLPHLKQWYAAYHRDGFVLIGVHTPEFAHEGKVDYVREAVARLGIAYPVVMDNNHRIWDAYKNEYWPSLYLIDKQGRIRYTHFGEGDYDTTEHVIVQLLGERL